jgi:hypothetical protein
MMLDSALASQALAAHSRPNDDQDSPRAGQLHVNVQFRGILVVQPAAAVEPASSGILCCHQDGESAFRTSVSCVRETDYERLLDKKSKVAQIAAVDQSPRTPAHQADARIVSI